MAGPTGDLLDLGEQEVEGNHLVRRLHLGQHQLVESLRRVLDDVDHVAVRPLRVPRVHSHTEDRVTPVELVDRLDDVVAGGFLLERRDGVLEVEEHHVGTQTGRLAQHLLAGAGHGEAGATGQVAGSFGHAGEGRRRSGAPRNRRA